MALPPSHSLGAKRHVRCNCNDGFSSDGKRNPRRLPGPHKCLDTKHSINDNHDVKIRSTISKTEQVNCRKSKRRAIMDHLRGTAKLPAFHQLIIPCLMLQHICSCQILSFSKGTITVAAFSASNIPQLHSTRNNYAGDCLLWHQRRNRRSPPSLSFPIGNARSRKIFDQIIIYDASDLYSSLDGNTNIDDTERITTYTTMTKETTTSQLSRPQRKALERAKKQQQLSSRRPKPILPLSNLYPTNITNTISSSTGVMDQPPEFNDNSVTKPLLRILQQIQRTRNQYQLRQVVTHYHHGLQNPTDITNSKATETTTITTTTTALSNSHVWAKMIVTAIYCSDYTLLRDTLFPQWRGTLLLNHRTISTEMNQKMTSQRHQDAVSITRALLFAQEVAINFGNNTSISVSNSNNVQRNQMNTDRLQHIQYSIQEVWNIVNTELFMELKSAMEDDDLTTRQVTDDSTNLLFFRAKALILIATWYFMHNEPFLAIRTCQLLEHTGSQLTQCTVATTTPRYDPENPQKQLSWIRLFQEASTCQSRIRQNTCLSTIDLTTSSAVSIPNVSPSTIVISDLPSNVVYSVLSARSAFPKQYNDYDNNSDRIYELISNALVRRVVFVTGAVSMAGCPPNHDNTAEVCFIGRSNVGKSSLINMVFNRKALAYTSKRPGKTQQFNFFTVNDIPDKEKEIKYGDDIASMTGKTKDDDSFYIVDLPGFGYAKVPEEQKQKWMRFMYEYLMTRSNLRIVFHLIDSRHGPMTDDRIIMQQIATTLQHRSGDNVLYVIVLTKADKNVKGAGKSSNNSSSNKEQQPRSSTNSGGKVTKAIQLTVLQIMDECGINTNRTPIILTSAETKLGRDDIWRYLQIATEKKK